MALAGAAWTGGCAFAADEDAFAGLDGSAATRTLRKAFGRGVTPEDGRTLYHLIVRNGYKRALDIGTARGYSAIWLAAAMEKTGGKVITLEINPDVAAIARENFRQAGVEQLIDSRVADALTEIPKLDGPFDFVFMDVGVALNARFLNLLQGKLRRGGAVTAHSADDIEEDQPDFFALIQNRAAYETRTAPTRSGGISVSVVR
jgi:caffeoyl-CoA O-methyltransferase